MPQVDLFHHPPLRHYHPEDRLEEPHPHYCHHQRLHLEAHLCSLECSHRYFLHPHLELDLHQAQIGLKLQIMPVELLVLPQEQARVYLCPLKLQSHLSLNPEEA